jgi:hypothetical protein
MSSKFVRLAAGGDGFELQVPDGIGPFGRTRTVQKRRGIPVASWNKTLVTTACGAMSRKRRMQRRDEIRPAHRAGASRSRSNPASRAASSIMRATPEPPSARRRRHERTCALPRRSVRRIRSPTPDHRTVEAREEELHIRFEDLVQRLTMLPLRRVFCRGCDRFRYFVK